MAQYAISEVDYDGTALPLNQRTAQPGANVVRARAGGSITPTHASVRSLDPRVTLETPHIAAALGVTGMLGALIASDALLTMFSKQRSGTGFAGTLSHLQMVMNKGILVPRQLTAGLDGSSLTLEAIGVYDGSNEVIVVTDSQTYSGTDAISEAFLVGPVMLNGTEVTRIQSITVDFGLDVHITRGSGQVRPEEVSIRAQSPSIQFVTTDASVLDTTGIDGVAQGATDSVVYLRKLDENGTVVADGTGQHISFTIDDGVITTEDIGGSDDDLARVMITPTDDGSNDILALSTTATIS